MLTAHLEFVSMVKFASPNLDSLQAMMVSSSSSSQTSCNIQIF